MVKKKVVINFDVTSNCNVEVEVDVPEGQDLEDYMEENFDEVANKAQEKIEGSDICDDEIIQEAQYSADDWDEA